MNKFEKSFELVEDIQQEEKFRFEYYLIKGQAYKGMEQYEEAIKNLLEGNKIYNSDTRLLNTLDACYYQIRWIEKALEVPKACLCLDPEQERIKRKIEEIEKNAN